MDVPVSRRTLHAIGRRDTLTLKEIEIKMTLAERVKTSREKKQLTKSDVARALNITPHAVMHWESGVTDSIRAKHLFILCRLLDVDPEWLANGVRPKWKKC